MNNEMILDELPSTAASSLLEKAKEIGPFISGFIIEEEKQRRLSKPVIKALREAGLYKLFMPQGLGGLELNPLSTAKIVEEIASHNTAAAWSMMVANTSTWWCRQLSDEGIDEIYHNGPETFIAGVFHPPMQAIAVDGGYSITGRSPLTSNVHEADWVFVSAMVMDHGKVKMNNGIPEMIGVFLDANQCEIIDTWYTLGMHATDSNDVAVKEAFVPTRRTYVLGPLPNRNRHYKSSLYNFPAIGTSVASLIAPIALAVAQNAINELKNLAANKVPFGSMVSIREKGSVQRKLGMAEALVQSSRAYLHQLISDCWIKTVDGSPVSIEERASLLLAITHTNQSCLQAVDMMYAAAGTSAMYTRNKLSHYFLNAQVIRQHGFANESRYETAGQIYFGLQPDLPVVVF